ncbi:MAG: hypothetical protein ACLR2E_18225 [Lachnospiraceae bacterium]
MKDKELRIYEILYGGICMSLPIFSTRESFLWRLLLPMAAAFCLYEAALRRKVFFSIFCSGQLLEWLVLRRAGISSRRPA